MKQKEIFTWGSVLKFLIFIGIVLLLSGLGLLPVWFWNLWPVIVLVGNIIFWGTLIKWLFKFN